MNKYLRFSQNNPETPVEGSNTRLMIQYLGGKGLWLWQDKTTVSGIAKSGIVFQTQQ